MLSETLPEFGDAIKERVADWPDDPMLYLLIGLCSAMLQSLGSAKSENALSSQRRAYELVGEMPSEGSRPGRRSTAILNAREPCAGSRLCLLRRADHPRARNRRNSGLPRNDRDVGTLPVYYLRGTAPCTIDCLNRVPGSGSQVVSRHRSQYNGFRW